MARMSFIAFATVLSLAFFALYVAVHLRHEHMSAKMFEDWCYLDTLIGCDAGPWRE